MKQHVDEWSAIEATIASLGRASSKEVAWFSHGGQVTAAASSPVDAIHDASEGTSSGSRTGSLRAGSVGMGVGSGITTGLGMVSGMSMGSEPS